MTPRRHSPDRNPAAQRCLPRRDVLAYLGRRRSESSKDKGHVMQSTQNRRRFLATLSSAGAAGFIGASNSVALEGPPETTTIQLARNPSLCIAPQYLVEEFLRAEGFTDVRYVMSDAGVRQAKAVAAGEIDFTLHFSAPLLIPIDTGEKITIIAGVHVGCFELFGNERIR